MQAYLDFLVSLRCICDPFDWDHTWLSHGEDLVLIDLIQFLLGGIIPFAIANYLVQFQATFVVSWNLITKLIGCRSPNLSYLGLVDSSS